jgi:FtsH-binding integral membrane protein
MNTPTAWSSAPTVSDNREQIFLRHVGLWMAAGLLLTTLVAGLLISQPEAMGWFFQVTAGRQALSTLGWIAMFAPLVLIIGMRFVPQTTPVTVVAAIYLTVTACLGITLAPLGLVYTPHSLLTVLVATIGAFAGFSAWGFFTSKSLAGVGRFAFMGLIGLIVLGFVQIFWPSSMLNFLLGCGGVVVFTLLTAWDMQKIRAMATEGDERSAIWGALSLYLDFVNLFLSLLRLMGGRK